MTIHERPSGQQVAMTGSVPSNTLGYFAVPTRPGEEISPEVVLRIVRGPLTAMQKKLTDELLKPGE